MTSIYKMVKSFVKEASNYAKHGAPNVTPRDYQDRLKACYSCEHLKKATDRCGLCGCLVEHKAKWATSKCPDKPERWAPQTVGKGGKKLNLKNNARKGNSTKAGDEVQPSDE
jgi:hypothetical protein